MSRVLVLYGDDVWRAAAGAPGAWLQPGVIHALRLINRRLGYRLVAAAPADAAAAPRRDDFLAVLRSEGVGCSESAVDPQTGAIPEFIVPAATDRSASAVIAHAGQGAAVAAAMELPYLALFEECPGAAQSLASWAAAADYLARSARTVSFTRATGETEICVQLNPDGSGRCRIQTGVGFFDHMLEQLGKHAGWDLEVSARGDLRVDEHHTIEDTALALGAALARALGDKRGIERYGFTAPLDEALAAVALDLSGRSWLAWDAEFRRERIGELPTEMIFHFFKSFCDAAGCTLHVRVTGENEHHKCEAVFKAVGRALRAASSRSLESAEIPSTKGVL